MFNKIKKFALSLAGALASVIILLVLFIMFVWGVIKSLVAVFILILIIGGIVSLVSD
jgi:hypothetical protein